MAIEIKSDHLIKADMISMQKALNTLIKNQIELNKAVRTIESLVKSLTVHMLISMPKEEYKHKAKIIVKYRELLGMREGKTFSSWDVQKDPNYPNE